MSTIGDGIKTVLNCVQTEGEIYSIFALRDGSTVLPRAPPALDRKLRRHLPAR